MSSKIYDTTVCDTLALLEVQSQALQLFLELFHCLSLSLGALKPAIKLRQA